MKKVFCMTAAIALMVGNSTLALAMEMVAKDVTTLATPTRIVPLDAGEVYHKSIAGSELMVLDRCGHRPEIEKQAEFSQRVQQFLA